MTSPETDRFEALIVPHLDSAYTLARYILRDEHDAQDAVQDAALRAFRYFASYRDGDPRAWFLAIVRNCCHTWRQPNPTVPLNDSLVEEMSQSLYDPAETDSSAIVSSQQAAITRAVQKLPIEFREVIVLREIQELSYAEISEVTGVPIGTVMSRLSRARKRLASMLGHEIKEAS
jgi:RNA polymerase sigma-70 factor (ECF subfamily)